ncbi:MAG: hypothetical protein HQK66_10840 [Desulfamplus sp.]|nr:hypothetical protein [Desulfamplus sp.]
MGTSGFTTVAHTEGMPVRYIALCESLSGYTYIYPLGHPKYHLNPVCYSHHRVDVNGTILSVISSVMPCGRDYTGRENKIAHHVVLESRDMVPCGPAWAMMHGSFFMENWNQPPSLLAPGRIKLPGTDVMKESHYAGTWNDEFGDAGTAGVLARWALEQPGIPSFKLYDPEKTSSILALAVESMVLLPPEKRWTTTFSTCFFSKPMDSDCLWRFCPVISRPGARPWHGEWVISPWKILRLYSRQEV